MDLQTMETSLRKIDSKFVQELTQEEKDAMFSQFKKLYAESISKVSIGIALRRRVKDNIMHLNKQNTKQIETVSQQLEERMKAHQIKRDKLKATKMRNRKLIQESWRRKLQDINRKKREAHRQSCQKALQMRKNAEKFLSQRSSPQCDRSRAIKTSLSSHTQIGIEQQQFERVTKLDRSRERVLDHYMSVKTQNSKDKVELQTMQDSLHPLKIAQRKQLQFKKMSNSSSNQNIKIHKERSEKQAEEKHLFLFQKAMQRLQKIEDIKKNNRKKAHQEAQKLRQLRQSSQTEPHSLQKYKQYKEGRKSSRIRVESKQFKSKSMIHTRSKSHLSESIVQHLENKKQIDQKQFLCRGQMLQEALKRLRKGKMKRVARDAVFLLKGQYVKANQ